MEQRFAPYEHFATVKTSAEAEFTSAEHFRFPQVSKKEAPAKQVLLFWRRHPDLNRGMRVLQTLALPLGYVAMLYILCFCFAV